MISHDFYHVLETKKEAGTKSAQLLCLHSYYLQDAVVWTSTIWG